MKISISTIRAFLLGTGLVFALVISACSNPTVTPDYAATSYAIGMATQISAMSQPTAIPTIQSTATAAQAAESTSTVETTQAPTTQPESSYKVYAIQQAFSKLYITSESNTAGAHLTQEAGGTSENQLWRFVAQTGESQITYLIQSYDGSLCLENTGDSIILNGCTGQKNQTWLTVPCLTYFGRYMCDMTDGSAYYLQSLEPLESNEYTKDFNVPFTGKVIGLQGCDAITGVEHPELTECKTAGWQINSQGVTGGHDLLWYLIPRD